MIKLPFSEKFLWDIYNVIEKFDKIIGDSPVGYPRTMKETIYPDLYKLRREYGRKQDRKNFARIINYLKKRGYLKIKNLENKSAIIITPKGKKKILKIKMKISDKKKRPDEKWQMVIFDIPEKRHKDRDWFRESLRLLGYKQLQKSIWISPYNVLKETQELIKNLTFSPYVKLLLVEEMEAG